MLQFMRHLGQSWLFKGLILVVLISSFSMWGIGDIIHSNPLQNTVAKVGSIKISVQDLNREFEQTLQRARGIAGPDLTAAQAVQLGVLDTALNGLVERAEVDQNLRRLDINVSEKALLNKLASQPQFRDKDGHFNKALFQQLLQQAHLTEHDFLEQGKLDMERHQLIDVLGNDGVLPQSIINAVYQARGQKRVLELVTLKNNSITDIPDPDDKVLHDFYAQNPKPFTAPEYRSITIARLATADVAKDITITDEQVQKNYDSKADQMTHPERRDILQVVVQSEDKAKQIAASAKASGNLATSAKKAGYDAVPLQQTEEKSLLPEISKTVFDMQVGQVSDPVKSSLGWHVLQLKKVTPAGKTELKDVKEDLRDVMKRDQAIDTATHMVNQIDDELAAGHALEDIADSMKLRLIKIPAIDAAGKTPDDKDPAEMPNKDDVLKSAFSQNAGEVSPIIDDKEGNYVIIRTDEITPSAEKPFDQVKTEVVAAWKKQEQAKRAGVEAEKIAKALREGKPTASFASQTGIEVHVSKPMSLLGDKDPIIPAPLLPQIFNLKKGQVINSFLSDQQIVIRLANIVDADTTGPDVEAAKSKVAGDLTQNTPSELTDQYLKYLRVLFPVHVNRDVLDTVVPQGS